MYNASQYATFYIALPYSALLFYIMSIAFLNFKYCIFKYQVMHFLISSIAFPTLFSGTTPIQGIDNDRLYPCPHIATDKSDPSIIYATWTAYGVSSQQTNGLDIYISKSEDGVPAKAS